MKKGEHVVIKGFPDDEFEILKAGRKMLTLRGDFSGIGQISDGKEFRANVVKVITEHDRLARLALGAYNTLKKFSDTELKQNRIFSDAKKMANFIIKTYKPK